MSELPGVTVKVDRRARRISLRVDARGEAMLVLPHECFRDEGLRFAKQKAGWLAEQQAKFAGGWRFAPDAEVPVAGTPHRIVHVPHPRGGVQAREGQLRVSGHPDDVPARIVGWLKGQAHAALADAVARYAAALDVPTPAIGLRDTKTRWGSCSSRWRLSFSWRLAMAPPHVLDYVAAHECAHLRELNHSPRFWALVAGICPDYRTADAWLKRHGRTLHRYG